MKISLKNSIMIAFIFAWSGSAHAEPAEKPLGGISGGGAKLIHQLSTDQVELFDFYEAGITNQVAIASLPSTQLFSNEKVESIRKKTKILLAALSFRKDFDEIVALTTRSFAHLFILSPAFGQAMFGKFGYYSWHVAPNMLIATNDVGITPVQIDSDHELVQVAFRNDRANVVTFSREWLQRIRPIDVVGLIFHEIYYALEYHIAKWTDGDFAGAQVLWNGSANARALVATTFILPINSVHLAGVLVQFSKRESSLQNAIRELKFPKETSEACWKWTTTTYPNKLEEYKVAKKAALNRLNNAIERLRRTSVTAHPSAEVSVTDWYWGYGNACTTFEEDQVSHSSNIQNCQKSVVTKWKGAFGKAKSETTTVKLDEVADLSTLVKLSNELYSGSDACRNY